jgi:CBS domain-containing protein
MPRSFDFSVPPFDRLDDAERRRVEGALDIAYFPRDSVVVSRGAHPESLYILIKGVVHERDNDDELVAVYTTGDAFDAMSLLKGKSRHQFIAHEEVISYLLPEDLFKQLTAKNTAFEAFYFQGLLEKLEAQSRRDEHPVRTNARQSSPTTTKRDTIPRAIPSMIHARVTGSNRGFFTGTTA